ncbi:MAG: DUF6778 family protein [Paracoccaceae bacterium]
MKPLNLLPNLCALFLLTACSGNVTGLFGSQFSGLKNAVDVSELPPMRVVGMVIEVPETLVVSEDNSYKPIADIVWREDPFGNRYSQVKTIIENAVASGVSTMSGALPVVLHIQVTRFHALTQRTRNSIGGVHEIHFLLTVTNKRTGEVMVPTYLVDSSLPGFGGTKAIEAERIGLTQKIRISAHLSSRILQELTGVQPVALAPSLQGE